MRRDARRDALQRMARSDLRLAPLVDELTGADTGAGPSRCALDAQHVEARPIHRLEGQRVLETHFRRSVDLPRGPDCAITVERCPVAPKAQRPRVLNFAWRMPQTGPAIRAQCSRSFALELSTGKRDPIFLAILGE